MDSPSLNINNIVPSIPTYTIKDQSELQKINLVQQFAQKVEWNFKEFSNFTLSQCILKRLTDLTRAEASPKQIKSYLIAIISLFEAEVIKDLALNQCFKILPTGNNLNDIRVIFLICKNLQTDKTLQQIVTYANGEMQIAQPLTLQDWPKLIEIHLKSFNAFQNFFNDFLEQLKISTSNVIEFRCQRELNLSSVKRKSIALKNKFEDWTEKDFCQVPGDELSFSFMKQTAYFLKIVDLNQMSLKKILRKWESINRGKSPEKYIHLINELNVFFQKYNLIMNKLDGLFLKLFQIKVAYPFPGSLYEEIDERKKFLDIESLAFVKLQSRLAITCTSDDEQTLNLKNMNLEEWLQLVESKGKEFLENLLEALGPIEYKKYFFIYKQTIIHYNKLMKKLMTCQLLGQELIQIYVKDYEKLKKTADFLNFSLISDGDYHDIRVYRRKTGRSSTAFVLEEQVEEKEKEHVDKVVLSAGKVPDTLNEEIRDIIKGIKAENVDLAIFSKIGALQSQILQQIHLTKFEHLTNLDYYVQMRFQTSLKEAGDHLFLAGCGVEILFQALAKANFADIQMIYLSILMDWACQAEQIASPFYIQSQHDLPLSHSLTHLYQEAGLWQALPLHLKEYLEELNNGLLLSRYPIQTNSNSSQIEEWISFWERINRTGELKASLAFAAEVKTFIKHISKHQQLASELLSFIAKQKYRVEITPVLESELQILYSHALISVTDSEPSLPAMKLELTLKRCKELNLSENPQSISYLQEAQGHIRRLISSCRMNASIHEKHLQPWFARNTLMGAQLIYELLYKLHCSLDPENIGLFEHLHSFNALEKLIKQKMQGPQPELNVSFGVHYPHLKLSLAQSRIIKRFVMWVEKSKDFWSDTKISLIQQDFEVFLEQVIEGVNPLLLAIENDLQLQEYESGDRVVS